MEQAAIPTTAADAVNKSGIEAPIGAPPARRRHSRHRYLRFTRRARRLSLIVTGLFGLGLRLSGAGVGIIFVILLGLEVTRHQVEIQPIAMPKPLAEAGYSPEVAARRLRDALDRLADAAATAGGRALAISMHGEAPEIVVPTVGVSLSTVATYLQRFLGYSPRTAITGEFTLSDPGVRLLLRLDGQVIFRSSAPTDHIDDIWLKAADAVMREISPYRAALALYDSDPDEAIRFASSIIRRYPPGDENVAWARLIRGARHIDFMQYSAAEKEFREVLLHAEGTSLASSSMPFSAPASYTEPAHFYLGTALLGLGKTEAAHEEFRRAVVLDPSDPGAHHQLGMTLMTLRRQREAAAEFDVVQRLFYDIFAGSTDIRGHGLVSAPTHISFGNALSQQQRNANALEQFRWAAALDPENDYAHRSLCDAHSAASRLDEALSECRLAVKYAPKRVENHLSLAAVLLEQHDLEGAGQTGQDALRLAPKSPFVHEMLGRIFQAADDHEKAVAEYREAARLAPEVANFHTELGNAFYGGKKFADATEAYRQAVKLSPEDAMLHGNLAGALAKKGEFGGAIGEYRKAIDLDPVNARWHVRLGSVYYEQKNVDGAIHEYQAAIDLKPDDPQLRNALGNVHYIEKDFAAAAAAYRSALALAQDNAIFHANLADALVGQNDVDGAIEEYTLAIRLKSDDAQWHNALGNLYYKQEDYAHAAEAYEAAVKLSPDNAVMHQNLASAFANQNNLDGAIQEYKVAIGLKPDNADWHNGLGNLYYKQPDYAAAAEAYNAALKLSPDSVVAHDNLAGALREQGQFDAAVEEARKAITLAPNDAPAQNALGLALWSRNPVDPDALTAYRAAIALDPELPDPYRNLATALEDHAASAESEARRVELLLQACRSLTEGLRQNPGDAYLQQDLAALAPEVKPSAECGTEAFLAKQLPTSQ